MKFYSEKLNKLFDSEKELKAEEKLFDEKNLQKENTKKELSQKIDAAELAVDAAYKNYDAVRQEAAKLMEESNQQILNMLNKAKEQITRAEKERTDAIVAFNQQFGTYRANYTGERAKRESERINNMVNDMFKVFRWPYIFN